MNRINNFIDFFPTAESQDLELIQALFYQLEDVPFSFCSINCLSSNEICYISESVESLIGYPGGRAKAGGVPFFYTITCPTFLPDVLSRQAHYLKIIKQQDFDTSFPMMMEFEAAFNHANGQEIAIHQFNVVVDFTDAGDPEYILCCNIATAGKTSNEIDEARHHINELLVKLWKLYSESSPRRSIIQEPARNILLQNYYPVKAKVELTNREKEILGLLANGLSTKQIAAQLDVSPHTIETYRKNLLEKFLVKNSAELIKEASKVFWFD